VATNRAAKSPPVITPAQARAVLAHYGTAIARANATLNRKLQASLEDGPALADDDFLFVNLKRAGLSMPQVSTLMSAQVFVPSQISYPAYFVGLEQRDNNTGMFLFRQTSQGGPWKVVLYANADPTAGSIPDIALDSHGYAHLAASRSLAVAPGRMSATTCQNILDSQKGDIGSDVGLSGYTQSFLDLSQQAQKSNQTASSRCVPQSAPLLTLATTTSPDGNPGGAFVMYAVRTSLILTGTRSNPIVVTQPPPGQSDVLRPGRYVQTNLTGFNMLGATVLAASDPNISGSQPPIDLPFGYGANAVVSATK
jgi:hypothetical protein